MLGWRVVLRGVDRVRELELFEVEEAVVETRGRVAVALDGEIGHLDQPLTYRIRPRDLSVISVEPGSS
jgi:diacylglycerol kinase family enzyme